MERFLIVTSIILCIFFLSRQAKAQGNQTVVNGSQTTAINFPTGGCPYKWTNNTPGIGLSAGGTGDIASFTAVNSGSTPITATVTATPVSAAAYAYITNAGANTVSVFDISTRSLVTTIPVGQQPVWASVSPNGSMVYIANFQSDDVSVIDASSNSVIANVRVGPNPICITLNNDGSLAYVSDSNFGSSYGSISVIDTKTNTVINTISLNYNSNGIVLSKDGTTLYVCEGNWVSVIDVATNRDLKDIAIGRSAISMTISPDGNHIYATSIDYSGNGLVTVINTTTNTIEATIAVDNDPFGIAISPDGQKVYVTNWGYGNISVINTANNTVSATIPDAGNQPIGVCFTPDGIQAYVINYYSSDALVINTANNAVVANIPLGSTNFPNCSGNFISSGIDCNSSPITFTITVNPTSVTPVITAGVVTGTISACEGSPSESPDVAQFTVSGNSLTNDIVATAPAGFEVSLSEGNGYGNTVTVPQSGGAINNVTIYVRSSASATGNIVGNVTLTSTGATDKTVTVTGKVNTLPTVSNIPNQKVVDGTTTKGVVFSGTGADTYNWVNDNPSIGISYGTSSEIVQFTAINKSQVPVIGTFTVTPINTTTGCSGAPVTFTIEVDPRLPAVITATGNLSSLSTIYGTPSASTSFSVSGTNMNAGILVTPPAGFEVSTDNINFSPTTTIGKSATINATTVYVRLTSQASVSTYSGNIVLSSSGAMGSIVPIPASAVNPAVLTITANNIEKVYGQMLTSGTVSTGFTSNGLQNNETIGNVFVTYNSGASPSDKAGSYSGSVVPSNASGGSFNPNNYTITYQSGDIIVIEGAPNQSIAIPNAFTPNGDGINDVWNIKSLLAYPSCMVSIFTRYGSMIYQSRGYAKPWDGVYKGNPLPAGAYYYIINLQNGQPQFSGWVALIR